MEWRVSLCVCVLACRSVGKEGNRGNSTSGCCLLNRSNTPLSHIKSWQRPLTGVNQIVYLTATLKPLAPWQHASAVSLLRASAEGVLLRLSDDPDLPRFTVRWGLICFNGSWLVAHEEMISISEAPDVVVYHNRAHFKRAGLEEPIIRLRWEINVNLI